MCVCVKTFPSKCKICVFGFRFWFDVCVAVLGCENQMIMRKKEKKSSCESLVPESWFSRKSCWEKTTTTADLNDVMITTITKPASWRIPAKKKKRMFNQPNKLTKWMNEWIEQQQQQQKELTGKFYTWINLLAEHHHHQYQTINEWMNVVLPCIV